MTEENNMNLGLFTYIAGIATILGLLIQIKDVFPQHRETRKNVLFIILGLFIGTLIGSLQKINVTFAVPMSGSQLLIGAIIIVVFVVLISAVFTDNNEKRMQLFGVSGAGAGLLFVILFGLFALQSPAATSRSVDKITNDELLLLADTNKEKGNFERSIYFLEEIKEDLNSADPRYEILARKISGVKKLQIQDSK